MFQIIRRRTIVTVDVIPEGCEVHLYRRAGFRRSRQGTRQGRAVICPGEFDCDCFPTL